MDFVALDVETANPDLASICQIGLVEFRNGKILNLWEWLVDPEDYFDGMNVFIHGIDEGTVQGQPTWLSLHPEISKIIRGRIVVSHTAFDRTSMQRACEKYGQSQVECTWLDSAKVVRRTWPELLRSGYGLSNVASRLGITFKHHNAREDARAAGEILLRAITETGLSVQGWVERITRPISLSTTREANPDGPLYGEVVVFTGALSMPRREAADAASAAGCEVAAGITKHTTLLIVGDQDIRRLAGQEKSSKHRKAEEFITKGQRIRIVGESDFQRLLASGA